MTPLRIGLVGARFAADLHAVNYRPLQGSKVELAAVASRSRASAEAFAKRHAVPRVFADYRRLVESPDVDVVDICSTTDTHHEVAIAAARAGKHVIVEKPLSGWFGEASDPREAMLAGALRNCDAALEAVARAEESHSGSHAAYAARWRTSGGGSLLRMGSHPVGVVLHLKHHEGRRRGGRSIRARAVTAEVAGLMRLPDVAGLPRFIKTRAEDVEDWSVAVITFEDGTMATVHANDVTLG
ncbi:MAG: Gfo/Idh/MocA family oxidoreductase, partial [Candidatus Rokubacteria bacterium]|nr:Gfo/Idh/MocA family oxidoreductase [Candidatus Rokubacteria bacterium]